MAEPQPSEADLQSRLNSAWQQIAGSQAAVRGLARLAGGHAGLTYRFERTAGNGVWQAAVLKMGAPGVRRSGAADIFRQARLLDTLRDAGVPVPAVLWADAAEEPLGAPYIVMEFMPGHVAFPLLRAGQEPPPDAQLTWHGAAVVLARMQSAAIADALHDWEPVLPLADRIALSAATLQKSPETGWLTAGHAALDALRVAVPADGRAVLVHGDFQPSNLLMDDGQVSGLIDWDLAHLGATGHDLGWLLMFADPDSWGPHWRTWCPLSERALLQAFVEAGGKVPVDLDWYRAFAHLRFAAIACFNVRLHRNGRRPDPVWELFAHDIPRLFDRARHWAARHSASLQ